MSDNFLTLRKQALEGEIVWDEIGSQSAYGIFFNMGNSIMTGLTEGFDNSIECEYTILLPSDMKWIIDIYNKTKIVLTTCR